MKIFSNLLILISVSLVVFISITCERKTNPATPNVPPNTTVANIPVDSTTIFALTTLHWDGEDNDGFIQGYQYRYITRHLTEDTTFIDSVVHDWVDTKETSVTIPVESSAKLNFQRFQVRAMDDKGDVDPTPAEKHFYTKQTVFPETELLVPQDNRQFFAIDHTTDWWQGIKLSFRATDEDGDIMEYGWKVNDGEWHWVMDTTLYIPPEEFPSLTGEHTISVTSRDNTNLVDPIGDSVKVNLIQPTFEKDVLIVDETDETLFPNVQLTITDQEVDSFYARVFGTADSWDFFTDDTIPKPPPKELMGQYKLVLWHADNLFTNPGNVHKLPEHVNHVIDYMNVGGDFIMGGWRILKSFALEEDFPKSFQEGSFIHDYLHILNADESYPLGIADFDSATGWATFDGINLNIDSTKLAESFYFTYPTIGLPYINVMPNPQASFTDIILLYANRPNSQFTDYRNFPIGLRYYGTSFDSIVLGFPLYFIKESDARQLALKMLQSLGI